VGKPVRGAGNNILTKTTTLLQTITTRIAQLLALPRERRAGKQPMRLGSYKYNQRVEVMNMYKKMFEADLSACKPTLRTILFTTDICDHSPILSHEAIVNLL
jgi:hypothetical protein